MPAITERLSSALADRYKIERRLGEGGMATVYLAEDLKHDRKVALKVLKPELAAVLGAERFVQEIKTTAQLQHPNILPLFDSGEADSFLYYVMPYIKGETLRDKLNREKQLGIDEALKLTTEVAEALDYAHRQNVIHRDIKPENILLHDGRPLVADFGIALAVSAAAGGRMTETGLSLGTPHYMSPEQATAEKHLTSRSDIYSLGAVLYEMLTGEPPHTGSTAQQVIAKIVTDPARPVTELRKSVPHNVAAAVAKSLEKLAADRFESASKFAEALTNPAYSVATTAPVPAGEPAPMQPWSRLTWFFAMLAGILLFMSVWSWVRLARNERASVHRQQVALGSSPAAAGDVGLRSAIALDGSAIAFVDTVDGTSQVWVKERERADATPLSGTIGANQWVTFSPDGEWVAFTVDGTLKKVPRGGGAATTLADSASFLPGAWLDDGTIVFPGPAATTIFRVSERGGPVERVVNGLDLERALMRVTRLPEGRGFLFLGTSSFGVAGDAWVFDGQTGDTKLLIEEATGVWYAPTGHLLYASAQGGIFAQRFDLESLSLQGAAVPVEEGLSSAVSVADAQLSMSGTLLFSRGPSGLGQAASAFWIDRDGRAVLADSSWAFPAPASGGIRLSPDNQRIAVTAVETGTGRSDVYVKRLPSGPASRITFEGFANRRPTWTPDGRSIVFVSQRAGQDDLWIKRFDASQPAQLLLDRDRAIFEGLFSPDGDWLIYRTDDDAATGRGDILGLRLDVDSVPVELVASEFEETGPAISPDGRWLAYASDKTGRKEVYVQPFPNVQDAIWQVSSEGGAEPAWAHGGSELFYRNGRLQLVAAKIATTPTFAVLDQRVLFEASGDFANDDHRWYDVALDDQRFFVLRPAQGTERLDLILVENFFEELKAKVGN